MRENDKFYLDDLARLLEEDRGKLVIISLENLVLIQEDAAVEKIIGNQKRLHDMVCEMYESIDELSFSAIPLFIENLTILEINMNLTEMFILLKTAGDESIELLKQPVALELNLNPENSIDDIYDYLMEVSKNDMEKSEKNYQKILEMKGDKHE